MLKSVLLGSAAMAALLSPPTWALAQESAQLEEVVVTARKVEESVQDVPVAMTTLSPTRMKDLSIINFSDVARSTPNLFVTRYNSNPASPLITIRGQAQQDVILSIDSPVGVYVDGVYLPHSFGLDAAMVDVERVEVLKGPQGTLYGKNTTGGALSVVTKNPNLTQFGGFGEFTLGNYDFVGINAAINVPIVQDKLAVRLVASNSNHNSYGRDARGGPVNDDHSRFYRAKIRWEPADNVRVLISGDYQRLWNRGSAIHLTEVNDFPSTARNTPATATGFLQARAELGLPNTPAGILAARNVLASYIYGQPNGPKRFYDSSTVAPQQGHYDGWGTSADIAVDLTDTMTFRSITSFRKFVRSDVIDIDASPFTIIESLNTARSKNWAEEAQLTGRGEKYNWIVGAYANWEDAIDISPNTITVPLINPTSPGRNLADLKQSSWAVYGQAGYSLTEQLRVTAGLRWTSETKQNISTNNAGPTFICSIPVVLRTTPAVCSAKFENTYDDYSYLLSLDYKPVEDVLLYAKTSRGFKGGGQNIRGSGTPESFNPFRPETVTDYEVGVKSDLLDRRLRINAAAFHSDYKDVQRTARILATNGNVVSLLTNAAKAKIDGAELEITARPIAPLTLNFSAGYTDAKYKEFFDAALGDRTNEPFSLPKTTWSVSGTYVIPMGAGHLRLAADYSWRSKVVLAPAAVFKDAAAQDAYGLLNTRVSFNIDSADLEIAAFVKNVAGKHYYSAAGSFDNSLGYDLLWVGNPRTYGVQLIKKFGGG
jgi:iron complex outermembrane recepter protein